MSKKSLRTGHCTCAMRIGKTLDSRSGEHSAIRRLKDSPSPLFRLAMALP